LLEGGDRELLFYDSECFRVLGAWLTVVNVNLEGEGDSLMNMAAAVSPHLNRYLEVLDFPEIWNRLARNNRPGQQRLKAFHDWFDGLRTMKLIHHLSAECFPRCGPEQSVPELLRYAGLDDANGIEQQLEILRRLQLGDDYDAIPAAS
jgi:hypothetical protein